MARLDYRRRAVLARIHQTLDEFYLRQEVDWDYDIRRILDRILEIAMSELEFGEGRSIDHALVIIQREADEPLEVGAGWNIDGDEKAFSRTIVEETLASGRPILCENARQDPRFEKAESIQSLEILSLLCVPIEIDGRVLGALYIERRDATHLFTAEDREFLGEFARTIAPYVKTALIHQQHVAQIRSLQQGARGRSGIPDVIGDCEAMRRIAELVRVAAGVERTVLITGESGCGKELLARAIHAQSRRAEGPFIVVDCSALSEHLLESELFGHVKGSFTGAVADKAGAFEQARGGTIFLDEISDASKSMQQQLRRVLQESEIRRVGESAHRKVDVRVLCATNRDLQEEVEGGRFIHDLFHRIHQFPLRLPPLRERKEDIPLLVDHFVATAGVRKNPPIGSIEPEALQLLLGREWRDNNVRELENFVKLAIDLCPGGTLDADTVRRTCEIQGIAVPRPATSADLAAGEPGIEVPPGDTLAFDDRRLLALLEATGPETSKEQRPYYLAQREFSGKLIIRGLRATGWKMRPAARLLGISPVKLRQDLKAWIELGIAESEAPELADVARRLEIPAEVLLRKLVDLGIELRDGTRGSR
ncbi:MAG: sigma 54-interacting transcriptional regulator [Planctomycetota bacterium]|jgi:transcriptional regulator with GAF, ATPase, and Fis domain